MAKDHWSLELDFPLASRDFVLDALAALCDRESREELARAKASPVDDENSICLGFLFELDAAFGWYLDQYQDPRWIDGRLLVGCVWLRTKLLRSKDGEHFLHLQLWPATSRMSQAFLTSAIVRDVVLQLLQDHNGYNGELDYGDGFVEPFWIRQYGYIDSAGAISLHPTIPCTGLLALGTRYTGRTRDLWE